jgi:hypothetical protein
MVAVLIHPNDKDRIQLAIDNALKLGHSLSDIRIVQYTWDQLRRDSLMFSTISGKASTDGEWWSPGTALLIPDSGPVGEALCKAGVAPRA